MESKFYIGQKVVAIRNHSQSKFKKGDVFTVLDIKQGCCFVIVKITDEFYDLGMLCNCGNTIKHGYSVYYGESNFAPIQEIGNMTFEEAIEMVTIKEESCV